jgi:murein DD-endopeptidase MepM/ murein hydrolase activator NlpD
MSTPLLGIGFGELHTIISQPYSVPDVHSDAGHHGVDLGSYDFHGKLIYNWPILSVFSGKVAGEINNRYPVGNCIIIESSYDQLPLEIVNETGINNNQSLYTMYCHMLNQATQKIGDVINVAQEIGLVGKSQTVEAHLHLEMVIGPQNQVIPSMAYYTADATEDEKKTYLWWRTSGTFTSFNPMNIIANLK